MNPWMLPDWCNAMRHPANVAELCEAETPSSICVPPRHGQQCPKISKKCSDHVIGLGLAAAMCEAARQEGRRISLAG